VVTLPGVGMSRSLRTLQAGRAFAALAVLFFHTNITLSFPKYLGREIAPAFSSGYSGVHFFFVLSGFVVILAHFTDIGRPGRSSLFFVEALSANISRDVVCDSHPLTCVYFCAIFLQGWGDGGLDDHFGLSRLTVGKRSIVECGMDTSPRGALL